MVALNVTWNGDEIEYVVTSTDPSVRKVFRGERSFSEAWAELASIEADKRRERILADGLAEADRLRKLFNLFDKGYSVSIEPFGSPDQGYSYSDEHGNLCGSGFPSIEAILQDFARLTQDPKH
ncbi:hypothetical protein ACWX0K_11650 [Nitrobacteraceae bacterium UC4446_H13]